MASSKYATPKGVVQELVQATGQSEEDVKTALQECQGDVNEAAQRLLDQPFFKVMSKKDKATKKKEVPQQTFREGRARGNGRTQQGRGKGRPSRGGSDSLKNENSNFQRKSSVRSGRTYQKQQLPNDISNLAAQQENNDLQQAKAFDTSSKQKTQQDTHINGLNKDDALQENQQAQLYQQQPNKQTGQQKIHVIKPGQGSSMAEILKRPKQQQKDVILDSDQTKGWQVREETQLHDGFPQDQSHVEEDYDQQEDYQENGYEDHQDSAIPNHNEIGGWDQPVQEDNKWNEPLKPTQQEQQIPRDKFTQPVQQQKIQPNTEINQKLLPQPQDNQAQIDLKKKLQALGLQDFVQNEFQKQQQQQKQVQSEQPSAIKQKEPTALQQSGPQRSNQQAQTDPDTWLNYQQTSSNSIPTKTQTPSQIPPQVNQTQQPQQQVNQNAQISQPQYNQNETNLNQQLGNFAESKYPNLDFQNFQSFKPSNASQPQNQAYNNQDNLMLPQNSNQNLPNSQSNQNSQNNFQSMIGGPLYSLNKLQGSQALQHLQQNKQQPTGLGQFQINDVQHQNEIGDSIDGQLNRLKAQGQEGYQKTSQIHPPNNSHPLYSLNNFGELSNQNDLSSEQTHNKSQNQLPIKQNKPTNIQEYLQSFTKNVDQHPNTSIDPKLIENLQNLHQAANSSFGGGLNNPTQQSQLAAQLQSMAQQTGSKPINNFLPHPQNLLQHDDVQSASNKLQMLQLKQQLYEQSRQNQVAQGPSPFVGQNEHSSNQHDKEPPSQISKSQLESLQNRLHGFGNQDGPQLEQIKDQDVGGKIGGEVNQRQFGNLNVQQNSDGIFSSTEQSKIESSQPGQQISNSSQMHNQIPNQNQVWGSMGGFPMPGYNQMYTNYGVYPFPTPTHPNINPNMQFFQYLQNPNMAGQYIPPQGGYHQGYMQPPNFTSQNVQHQNQNQQFQQGNQMHVKYPPHFVGPPGIAGQAYQGQNSQGFGNQFSNFNNSHNFGSSYSGNRFQRFNKE